MIILITQSAFQHFHVPKFATVIYGNALEDSIEVVSKLLFTPVNHMCDFFAFATIHYFNDFFSSFSFCQHQQSFWTTPKKVDMEKDLVHDYSRHKKRKKSNGTIPTL